MFYQVESNMITSPFLYLNRKPVLLDWTIFIFYIYGSSHKIINSKTFQIKKRYLTQKVGLVDPKISA